MEDVGCFGSSDGAREDNDPSGLCVCDELKARWGRVGFSSVFFLTEGAKWVYWVTMVMG